MTLRGVPAYRLALVPLVALLAFAGLQAAQAESGVDGFERALAIVAGAGLAVAAVVARPAWTISISLALSVFSSHWGEVGSPITLDRFGLLLGVGSLLVREWRHRDGRLQTRPIDWLLMVVGLYALMSALIAGDLEGNREERFELIENFGLVAFVLFFVAPFAFRTEHDRRILLGVLVALGFYIGTMAILETTGPESAIVPSYITDDSIGRHPDRARGPALDAGANGLILFGCGVAAVLAFGQWRSRRWRIFALLVAALCALGVLLALTRAGWLGAIVGTPIALLWLRETRRYLIPVVAAGVVLVIGALAVIPGLRGEFDERRTDNQPLYDRRNSNAAALRMIDERPLLGFGWGQFAEDSPPYYRQHPDYPLTFVEDLHNLYLSHAVELGLIGVSLWIVALLAAIGGAALKRGPPELRPWKAGLVAISLALFVGWAVNPGAYLFPTLLMWTWAGVAWGGRTEPELRAQSSGP